MIVKRIYQIADVHIPTYQRMDMFAVQLEKLIASIRDDINAHNLRPEEVRIVLCGDLVHSKNIVTNELNVFASTFIRNLSALAKVVCITGNHDIIEISKKIDTYDTSILPYEDCCTVFLPKYPSIKPNLERVKKAESRLDVEALIDEAIEKTEHYSF